MSTWEQPSLPFVIGLAAIMKNVLIHSEVPSDAKVQSMQEEGVTDLAAGNTGDKTAHS